MPVPAIDYSECINDSPKFRKQLLENERSLDELEQKLEKLMKSYNGIVDSGIGFISQQSQFIASLYELKYYFNDEQETKFVNDIDKIIHTFQKLLTFQRDLIHHDCKSAALNVNSFLKENQEINIKQMKETRGIFNKCSNELDSALQKNSAVSKSKASEVEESSNQLIATRGCFRLVLVILFFSRYFLKCILCNCIKLNLKKFFAIYKQST